MIILDTNVISELMRPHPDEVVESWVNSFSAPAFYLTTVTEAEIYYGAAIMPSGKRSKEIFDTAAWMFQTIFPGRILPFDTSAARVYADIAQARRALRKPISQSDAQIAAIARSRGAGLATRNVKDYGDCGLTVVNPWEWVAPISYTELY